MPVLMLCDLLVKQMLRDRTFPKLSTTDHKAQGVVFLPLIGVNINFTTARICRFREVMFSTVCLFTGGGEGGVWCHWSVWGPYLSGSVNMYSLIPPTGPAQTCSLDSGGSKGVLEIRAPLRQISFIFMNK